MLRAVGLGALLFGFWVTLSGHYTPLLLSLGVFSCVVVVYLSMRMDVVDEEGVPFHVLFRMWSYGPWLLKEILVANIAVAKIILDPRLPIRPRVVMFHGTQRTDLGRAIYANSITLTPGTITTGVDGQEYEVHALMGADLDPADQDEMDRRCTRIERPGAGSVR